MAKVTKTQEPVEAQEVPVIEETVVPSVVPDNAPVWAGMAKVTKTQEPVESVVPSVVPDNAPVWAGMAKVTKPQEPSVAPDNVPAWAGDAFKSMTFDNRVWYVYAQDGRRISCAMTEDEAVRLVRGFGVR